MAFLTLWEDLRKLLESYKTLLEGEIAAVSAGGVIDATPTNRGLIQLAGDLAGTATSPTVTGGTHHTHTSTQVSDSTATGRAVLTAADASAARIAIAAGTSNVIIGTIAGTAKIGSYQPASTDITDATATGRALIVATDATAARTAISAGTSSLVIGTTGGTAKDGAYQPTAANISDSTATGRSVLTATDATAARTAISAGTSSLAIGTSSSTAKAGDYQPTAANISDSTATGRAVVTAVDAAAGRTAIGAGTSSLAIGTTSLTAKAGDYQPTAANISDSTTVGRALIVATDAAAGRSAIGAGTGSSSLVLGTTLGTAKDGAYQPTAANISDSTSVGRAVLTAADASAARIAMAAGTSNVIIGTIAGTAKIGSYQPAAADISDSTAVGRAVIIATDAAAGRTAIGAGTSSLAIGTTNVTAKAGDYQPASTNISDSTTVGRAVIVATDAAAARTATACAPSARLVSAGTGLTGGGDLSADRTLTVAYGATSTTACVGNDSRLANMALGTNFSNQANGFSASSKNFAAINSQSFVPILILGDATLTGIRFRKGTGTIACNVIAALYNAAGSRVAVSGTVAAGTVASAIVSCAFSPGTYVAVPGLYWASIVGSTASGDFVGWAVNECFGPYSVATQGSFASASSFTPVATTVQGSGAAPALMTY